MNSGWRKVKLGDTVKTNKRSYSSKDNWTYINYLDTGNITENIINEAQRLIVDRDKIPSRAKRKVLPYDIIYSTVRPNQKHFGIIKKPLKNMLVSTGFVVISPIKEEVDNTYLYYYLSQEYIVKTLHAIAEQSTSTYPAIKPSDIENLEVNIPSIPTQQKIAAILSSLDNKIENNRKTCKKLEEIAQAIFKQWFVDFEFPNKEGKPYKSSGGKMKYCEELGKDVPKGWKCVSIKNFIDYYIGGDWGKESPNEEYNSEVLCIRGADFPQLKSGNSQNIPVRFIKPSSLKKRNLEHGDILLEISGGTKNRPVGRTVYIDNNFIKKSKLDTIYSNFCRLLRTKKNWDKYLYLYLNNIYMSGHIEQYQVQSTGIANFQFRDFLDKEKVVCPNENILVKFNKIIGSIYSKKYNNSNTILQQIRDATLPKLMSGELPADDVEL